MSETGRRQANAAQDNVDAADDEPRNPPYPVRLLLARHPVTACLAAIIVAELGLVGPK